jgi:hypothetical protein
MRINPGELLPVHLRVSAADSVSVRIAHIDVLDRVRATCSDRWSGWRCDVRFLLSFPLEEAARWWLNPLRISKSLFKRLENLESRTAISNLPFCGFAEAIHDDVGNTYPSCTANPTPS